jgi:hypothetical protein
MDFEFERMSGELVGAIESAVNEELLRARDVRVNVLPREEAFAIPDLIRTKVNLLPEGIQEIRTIEIVGLDPPGGRRHARREHPGGRHDPGHRVREQGPHQQADPDGAGRPGRDIGRRADRFGTRFEGSPGIDRPRRRRRGRGIASRAGSPAQSALTAATSWFRPSFASAKSMPVLGLP